MRFGYRFFCLFLLSSSLLSGCSWSEPEPIQRYWLGEFQSEGRYPLEWHGWQKQSSLPPTILPDAVKTQPPLSQLLWVQNRANMLPFRTDQALWGRNDYWATPAQFFAHGGDCEDYALAKLAMLRELGWREEDMRLLLVQDMQRGGIEHAVLWVKRDGVLYLLDNQSHGLLEAEKQHRYLPRYGMNATGFWRY